MKFFISTDSKYTKNSETKNLAGDTITFNLVATVTFTVSYGENKKIFEFAESSTINNLENQLDENVYETNIKKNFASSIMDKFIIKIFNLNDS